MQSPRSFSDPSPAGEVTLSRDRCEQLNRMDGNVSELLRLFLLERNARVQLSNQVAQLSEQVSRLESRLTSAVKEVYTVREVAAMTRRHPDTVRRWIRNGHLEARRKDGTGPRGGLLIPREALRDVVQSGFGEDLPAVTVAKPNTRAA